MSQETLFLITIISPLFFVITAIASWFQKGVRPQLVIKLGKIASGSSIIIALIGCAFVIRYDLLESGFIGFEKLGFSLRLDSVSVIMFLMIALLSFIIIKFSVNYLEGDPGHGSFIGRLAATIASVQLLVLSGNVGLLLVSWILTSISLHRLLIFYPERPIARIAARKKFILARAGDICLLIAIILLYSYFETGNLQDIFSEIRNNTSKLPFIAIELPALLLAFAAILKSAQFPTHGWLIEVMETPTPVSALLHAGLLNAGPFLIIRMAVVMNESISASVLLMVIGGLTALFASISFLTQTSIKTALGYSSVGHMGFSLMVSGLGVYSAALLHLVAHSFYKAHKFLSSGSGVEIIKASGIKKIPRKVKGVNVLLGIIMAFALYLLFAMLWGIDPQKEFALLVIGSVIFMGLSRIFTSALYNGWNFKLWLQATGIALMVTISFFMLESGTHFLICTQVPELTMPSIEKIVAAVFLLILFGAAVLLQILAPLFSPKAYQSLAIHFRNGLYTNAVFDRLVNASKIHSRQREVKTASQKIPLEETKIKHFKEQMAS